MPALPDRAFHVALHRDGDPIHGQPPLAQRVDGKPHHDLRPAHHGNCTVRIDRCTRDHGRYDADIAAPIRCGVIDRDRNVDTPAPCFELPPVEDFTRTPRTIEQSDFAVLLAMGEHVIDYWAERCETEPARHDDNVAAFALGNGPIRAIRSAHANDLIPAQPSDRAADGADCPHRMHDPALFGRIPADADRRFAQPEHVKHIELACDEGEGRRRCQFEGCDIRRLVGLD